MLKIKVTHQFTPGVHITIGGVLDYLPMKWRIYIMNHFFEVHIKDKKMVFTQDNFILREQ